MKPDLNNPEYIERLKEAATSEQGGIIIDYIEHVANDISLDEIEIEGKSNEEVGEEYKILKKAQKLFKTLLNYIYFDN